jgi:hypothetical protein
MTSYIIGDNNKNNYDLDYIPYGRILQERINETIVSPDNMIQCILYTLHLAGYYTFEYYTSILKQLYIYTLTRVNNGILTFGEEVNLGLSFDINLRAFIIKTMEAKKAMNDNRNTLYYQYVKIIDELDKFMFKLLININDDIFDILQRRVYPLTNVSASYKNSLMIFEREVKEFRRLYNEKEQRVSQRKEIYKIFYRNELPLDIVKSEVNKYL